MYDGQEELSILKMSAKLLGLVNHNGWGYFWLEGENKELVALDSLRYRYKEKVKPLVALGIRKVLLAIPF